MSNSLTDLAQKWSEEADELEQAGAMVELRRVLPAARVHVRKQQENLK